MRSRHDITAAVSMKGVRPIVEVLTERLNSHVGGEILELIEAMMLLQRDQTDARNPCERLKAAERDGSARFIFVIWLALPANADLEPLTAEPFSPESDQRFFGVKVGDIGRDIFQCRVEAAGQAHQRALKIKGFPGRRLINDAHHRLEWLQEPMQRGPNAQCDLGARAASSVKKRLH